jgi:hypothetical protein
MHGISPETVRALTMVELDAYLDGARERQRENARLVAWQIAAMINLWSDKKTTPGEVMGEVEPAPTTYDVDAELDLADRMRIETEEAQASGWDRGLLPDDNDANARMAQLLEDA